MCKVFTFFKNLSSCWNNEYLKWSTRHISTYIIYIYIIGQFKQTRKFNSPCPPISAAVARWNEGVFIRRLTCVSSRTIAPLKKYIQWSIIKKNNNVTQRYLFLKQNNWRKSYTNDGDIILRSIVCRYNKIDVRRIFSNCHKNVRFAWLLLKNSVLISSYYVINYNKRFIVFTCQNCICWFQN